MIKKIPDIPLCFFCVKPAGQLGLHEVMTLELGTRVRECVQALSDDRLLAKLATCDMVAIEAKYHSSCLTQLYNRRRSYERAQYSSVSLPSSSSVDVTHGIVFAELIAYINDVRSVSDIRPVFKLVDLRKTYGNLLQQVDGEITGTASLNSTRLKDKLLEHFPYMRSQTDGHHVLMVFDDDIGTAMFKACSRDFDQDAICLSRAAEIVRHEIFGNRSKWSFNGSFKFSANCNDNSVPNTLLALVSMILQGPSIDVHSLHQHIPAAENIAQLIVFNSVQHNRSTNHNQVAVAVRHNKTQETPLPLYIGLSVHAATRKKSLIDKLFDVGVCVSYDRLMSILSDLASGVCQRFEEEQAVCPLNFKGNLFTTAAVDNIDHSPSSTSAQRSFHGTGISLQQHPDVDTPGNDRNIAFLKDVTQTKSYSNLPVAYTSVPPVRLVTDKPSVSSFTGHFTQTGMYLTDAVKADNAWLDDIWQKWQKCSFDSDSVVSWSVYNAQNPAPVQHALSLCGMLPLFHENAHNVSMIRHSMDVVKAAVSKLNPGQVPLKRNKLSFFATPKPTTASKMKSKVIAARNDSVLFSRLYIACQIRNTDLDEFFRHENQVFPPSLSDAGSLHLGTKSDLLSCLSNVCQPMLTSPCVDALVIDGAAIVNMLQPKSAGTFADYANLIFIPYIRSQLAHVKRIDIVWDRYDTVSLKGLTRAKRGFGMRRQVTESAPVPHNWHDFLRNDDNKTALFTFLAQRVSRMPKDLDKHVVVTLDTTVLTTMANYDIAQLSPCTHEEADTRIFLHVADLVRAGNSKIVIKTVDTDVVVLAIAFQQKIACLELWVALGTGQNLRYIPAHELACILGPERACALPMFHAFTGCDTVSAFIGRGKKTCWEVWNKYPDVTVIFNELSKLPPSYPIPV